MNRTLNGKLKNGTSREILFYAMIPFGMSTIHGLMSTALNMYFTDVLKISMGMVTIVFLISSIWDAVTDPVFGMFVDKTRTKWGKCRPYIIWSTGPVVLMTALLFSPVDFGETGNFIFATVAYCLYYAAYTSLDIPYQGMTPLLFPENRKRVKAVSFANIVGSTGSILPSILFFTIAGFWGVSRQKEGYFFTALFFSVMSGIFLFTSFFGVKEKIYIPPKKQNYLEGLKVVFKDRKMILLLLVMIFNAAVGLGNMFIPYFAKWNSIGVIPVRELGEWLGRVVPFIDGPVELTNEGLLTPILQIGSGIAYMLSMALVPRLLRRMDKRKLMIYSSLLGAAACILAYFIGIYIVPYNTVPGLIFFIAVRFFTNFPVGIGTVLFIAMFSDVTDDLELKHNKRLEGTVFSFRALVGKMSGAILNAVMLLVIAAYGYNVDNMTSVAGDSSGNLVNRLVHSTTEPHIVDGTDYAALMNMIFFMLTAASAIGLVLQAIPLFYYDFDEDAQEEKLRVYREEKERLLNEEIEAEAKKQGAIV